MFAGQAQYLVGATLRRRRPRLCQAELPGLLDLRLDFVQGTLRGLHRLLACLQCDVVAALSLCAPNDRSASTEKRLKKGGGYHYYFWPSGRGAWPRSRPSVLLPKMSCARSFALPNSHNLFARLPTADEQIVTRTINCTAAWRLPRVYGSPNLPNPSACMENNKLDTRPLTVDERN